MGEAWMDRSGGSGVLVGVGGGVEGEGRGRGWRGRVRTILYHSKKIDQALLRCIEGSIVRESHGNNAKGKLIDQGIVREISSNTRMLAA